MNHPFNKNYNILIIGDIMVDHYIHGIFAGKSQEASANMVKWQTEYCKPGGAANVALNVQALGSIPILAGCTGLDPEGEWLFNEFRKSGLCTELILSDSTRKTTKKTRVLDGHKHLIRLDREDVHDIEQTLTITLLKKITRILEELPIDTIILQDYNKGVLTPFFIEQIIRISTKYEVPFIVDPKFKNFYAFRKAMIFKPNKREIEYALGKTLDQSELLHSSILDEMRERMQCQCLMVTLSDEGIIVNTHHYSRLQPAFPRLYIDGCGAGDTVLATLACLLPSGMDYWDISFWANLSGGQVCEHPGVAVVDQNKLLDEHMQISKSR
ncbi:MAG TPA: PfkB family carbohydrate kinase [Saprospiraceae bacterium]|nr:PfkB family carbohydrate kinase [Saprospiraceae bacterium]